MKKVILTASLPFFASVASFAQIRYQEAPEKWSMPVKIKELSVGAHSFAAQPTLTADGKTMYYYYYSDGKPYGISKSVWQDSVWSPPVPLNSNVNRDLAEGPSVSPDGKRLNFRMYGRPDGYGGWDLYYSDWDSLTQDWGPAKNLGPTINRSDTDDWSCMTPDNKHLYMIRYPSPPRESTWNDTTKSWGPTDWVDLYRFLDAYGRAVAPANRRKVYYDPFIGTSNTHDIYVNYYDTLSREWSYPMVLNLNKMMDTLASVRGQIQADPWISPDGRTLYFTSDHDSSSDIWISKMMIDENGIAVSVEPLPVRPENLSLSQNYPNPFNPATIIEYEIASRGHVDLRIFDLLGREVIELVDEERNAGRYRVVWNGKDRKGLLVSSGTYFYRIEMDQKTIVRKMITVR